MAMSKKSSALRVLPKYYMYDMPRPIYNALNKMKFLYKLLEMIHMRSIPNESVINPLSALRDQIVLKRVNKSICTVVPNKGVGGRKHKINVFRLLAK